jgi:hypothetical protein
MAPSAEKRIAPTPPAVGTGSCSAASASLSAGIRPDTTGRSIGTGNSEFDT